MNNTRFQILFYIRVFRLFNATNFIETKKKKKVALVLVIKLKKKKQ